MIGGRDQAGATARGDIVGRDKRTDVHLDLRRSATTSKIEALKVRLLEEMQNDHTVPELIESLQQYQRRRKPSDGVEGLENKLRAAAREHEILDALEQKELFAKLLAPRVRCRLTRASVQSPPQVPLCVPTTGLPAQQPSRAAPRSGW